MDGVRVERLHWREWPAFAPTWERVHQSCREASFFLSRPWVDCWLATYGEQLDPEVLAFLSGGDTVGCCLLTSRTQWVRGIPLRRVYLNCAGEDEGDSTYIEYNSVLSAPGYADAVARSLAESLGRRRWDELVLAGMVEGDSLSPVVRRFGAVELQEAPARHVEFSRLREERRDFLTALSAKNRYHVRRTQRAYEEVAGPCRLRVAQTPEEASRMLRQMAALHQARWEGRGQAGCFRSAKFTAFHERLIATSFDRILFFRLQAGEEVVGLLYCFLHRGWVYHYQSGFQYRLDERRSPGLLTLYHAMSYCLERSDIAGFDFMAGDNEYKRALTREGAQKTLCWYTIRRRTCASTAYLWLRTLKRKYAAATRQGD
jgi:CelD/BcsL family acetyltransferase involved in cellulose biosynthesis